MPYLSLTTWSLHRNLGPLRWTEWDAQEREHRTVINDQPERISLLALPSFLAENGFSAMEVCHFNFPDTSEEYLQQLKEAVRKAGITFYTLLADYGDISSADEIRRSADIEWIKGWIDIASAVGAERVRVIGGDANPSDREALERSCDAMKQLCDYAEDKGVRVVTENFKALTSTSENCLALLEACGGRLGLTSDFGNFSGPSKYEELGRTVPRSESIHAKAQTDAGGMPDAAEFARCMEVVRLSGYEGPITIVYDGPGELWDGVGRVRALAEAYL